MPGTERNEKLPLKKREQHLEEQVQILADRLAFAVTAVEEMWDASFEAGDVDGCTFWEDVKHRMIGVGVELDELRKSKRKEMSYKRALHYVRGMISALMSIKRKKAA